MTLEGAADRAAFEVFVEQVLVPSLTPGQLVIWDNLSVHKSTTAAQLLADRGCRMLFLTPYSPDFAPIEQALSKVNPALRRTSARTRAALAGAIGAALATITANAQVWFAHCGSPIPTHLIGSSL